MELKKGSAARKDGPPGFAKEATLAEGIIHKALGEQLLKSVKEGHPAPELEKLLDAGADPDHADEAGMTCLMHAAKRMDLEAGILLAEHGAERSKTSKEGKDAAGYLAEAMIHHAEEDIVPAKGEILRDFLSSGAKSGKEYYMEHFNPALWA
jgi:hypothetical protein